MSQKAKQTEVEYQVAKAEPEELERRLGRAFDLLFEQLIEDG